MVLWRLHKQFKTIFPFSASFKSGIKGSEASAASVGLEMRPSPISGKTKKPSEQTENRIQTRFGWRWVTKVEAGLVLLKSGPIELRGFSASDGILTINKQQQRRKATFLCYSCCLKTPQDRVKCVINQQQLVMMKGTIADEEAQLNL